jgi:tetratricopeptide (TPR) repeat protein
LSTVREHETPLAQATTSSLEALKAYSTGFRTTLTRGSADSIPHFLRALQIDPNFAMAYAHLGLQYSNLGESVLSKESTSKAYELRDRASDPEKFFVTLIYYRQVTGNLDKALQTAQLWAQTYPRDIQTFGLMSGFSSQGTAHYEMSIEAARKALALDPDFTFGYLNEAYALFYLDRPAEAANLADQARERKLEPPEFLVLRYYIALLKGDRAGMNHEVSLAQGRPGAEDWMTHHEAMVAAYSGRLPQARKLSQRASDLALQAGERERAATYQDAAAVYEGFFGNAAEARRRAKAALEISNGREVAYATALALALAGDFAQAETLANDLDRRFPEDTSVRYNYLPVLRGLFALDRGDAAKTVEELEAATRYELAIPAMAFNVGFFGSLYPAYVRGEAYVTQKKGAEAAAEFQKLIDHRGITFADPAVALSHLQIGRAWAAAGASAKAKAAYTDFLTLWKDADPDIPVLKQARAEFAKIP